VTRDEILGDLLAHHRGGDGEKVIGTLDELARHVEARRRVGQKIVFTNGCFDLLHPGHARFMAEAAALGDVLVVAVNSDEGVRKHKGPERPIVPENERAYMLAALQSVDLVYVFREETPHRVLEAIRPDILVKGGTTPVVVGREVVEFYGGRVHTLGETPNFSTTNLVTRIRHGRAA
jgi:D-beta-D-heptose 7-phosphate kinase/D-beta-D-heptose 1-phosphate adenosyltransferase